MIAWSGTALAATPVAAAVEHVVDRHLGAIDPPAMATAAARGLEEAFPPAVVAEDDGTFVVRWDGAEVARYQAETPALLAEGLEEVVDALEARAGSRAASVALIDGLVRSLAPTARLYSHDGPPSDDALRHAAGASAGLDLVADGTGLRVVEVHPSSDAARAGIVAGDEILRLDGASATSWPALKAELRARGPVGTTVEVAWRDSDGAERVARLARDDPDSSWVTRDGIAVLRPDLHQRRWTVPVGWWQPTPTPPPSSVVLDLRGNPGGSLIEGGRMADLFVGDGTIVRTEGRNGPVPALVEHVEASPAGLPSSVGVVVLVDERTTGAAELVTAALLHHERAVVVGAPTAGRWIVDQVYPLGDGLALRLSVARMVVGNQSTEAGIEPDRLLDPRRDGASDPALEIVLATLADLRRPTRRRILEALPDDLPPPPATAPPPESKDPLARVEVRLVPAPGGARVEVVHDGPEPLPGLDVYLLSGKDDAVRAEGGRTTALPPGVPWGVTLPVEATPVRLRVDVDGHGTILHRTVDTAVPVVFAPPELDLRPSDGGLVVDARDPELVGVSVWRDGRKVAWHPTEGASQILELPDGPLEVRAHDATGLETRRAVP